MDRPAEPELTDGVLVAYTDGGSRGNPGPAASGWVVGGLSFGKYLGVTTNNDAEYQAIIEALRTAKELLGGKAPATRLEVRMDSELACKQLNGLYKVKNPRIKEHYAAIKELVPEFAGVRFVHVYREQNKEADAAVNEVLDAQ